MSGSLERWDDMGSVYVKPRTVDVWLPPGYADAPDVRYPVLYLHDGQNLFLDSLSYSGVAWDVHLALLKLVDQGLAEPAILVGIWNTLDRIPEYMPQQPLAPLRYRPRRQGFVRRFGSPPRSDAYLRFLVEELKPKVDAAFRTRPDETLMVGSSMGGLITLYAFCRYPGVFRRAACLSPSWSVAGPPLPQYLKDALPPPAGRRLYFDSGREARAPGYKRMEMRGWKRVRQAGYREGQHLMSQHFPDDDHSEAAWRARLHIPLAFLFEGLGKK